MGILTGTIDKLLVFPGADDQGVNVEIIDFKTNRFRGRRNSRLDGNSKRRQLSFDFSELEPEALIDRDLLIQAEIEASAREYRVQMQAYALAVRDLIPGVLNVRVTLHFLAHDVEVCLPDTLLEREACASAIDETMLALVSSSEPEAFTANPAEHCRVCNFVDLCSPGRQWLSND